MTNFDEMTLEEIDAIMAQLRDRRRILKKTGIAADKKITTLEKRRDKFMMQVLAINEQVDNLRRNVEVIPSAPLHRRGRRPKSALLTEE